MSLVKDIRSSQPLVDERGAAFGRLASRVLATLNDAVEHRRKEGVTNAAIALKVGCHKSVLSRVLNGKTRNLTLKTISDILWAVDFEPEDFKADAIETISPNFGLVLDRHVTDQCDVAVVYSTKTVRFEEFDEEFYGSMANRPRYEQVAL